MKSIFNGKYIIISMSSVQHVEKHFNKENKLDEVCVVTDKTKWNFEHDTWENSMFISNYYGEADKFLQAYCCYLESEAE